MSRRNAHRVLINLHGGGFFTGWGVNSVFESLPVASLGRIRVITVNYREAPEAQFPAASEDVASVYRALLKRYRPENIGIYGCSAGGILAAEALAWFQAHGLPRPGAAGIFCAGATPAIIGDSMYVGSALTGTAPPPVPLPKFGSPLHEAYFGDADVRDPLVSPVYHPAILAKFPPTLIISGTRDIGLSAAVYSHTQLVKAGVEADLHVWEGMPHAAIYTPSPESSEAWKVVVDFFDRHLGTKRRR